LSKDKNEPNGNESEDKQVMLTPWQKENQKYREMNGNQQGETASHETSEETPEKVPPPAEILDTSQTEKEESRFENVKKRFKAAIEHNKETLKRPKTPQEKKLIKQLILILSVLGMAMLITIYFISPLSKVDNIVIAGVEKSDPQSIATSSGIRVGGPLWQQYRQRQVIANSVLEENPRLKSVAVSIVDLNRLKVSVEEYPVVAYAKQGDQFFQVIESGKIMQDESVTELSEKLPVLRDFKENDSLQEVIKAYNQFDASIQRQIMEIQSLATKKNPFRIKLFMKDGNEVIGLSTTIATKMPYYDKVVAEMDEKGVIDMEAGDSGIFSYPFSLREKEETKNSTENSTD